MGPDGAAAPVQDVSGDQGAEQQAVRREERPHGDLLVAEAGGGVVMTRLGDVVVGCVVNRGGRHLAPSPRPPSRAPHPPARAPRRRARRSPARARARYGRCLARAARWTVPAPRRTPTPPRTARP